MTAAQVLAIISEFDKYDEYPRRSVDWYAGRADLKLNLRKRLMEVESNG